jgi:NTP pyrophosphatase (non-canonical NTP hydrolase)
MERELLREKIFIDAFRSMQTDMQQINEDHGFNDTWKRAMVSGDSEFINAVKGLKLALIAGELSEALEGMRKGNNPDNHIPDFTSEEAELADAVIRIMNYASDCRVRLAEAIVAKNEYNRNRPFRHGGKAF